MKLTVFQAAKGDCLLLEGADGRRMLVDGGMPLAYTAHVAPALSALRGPNGDGRIDLVYVSHIDQDHIGGILRLLDDVVAWRVHDHHLAAGNASHAAPHVLRPPEIDGIWHNAFHEQVGDNAGPIGRMLAASASILAGAEENVALTAAVRAGELATSVSEAIRVSRRIGPGQLGIRLNFEFGGGLAYLRDGLPSLSLGGMRLFVLGPTAHYLRELREEWNAWLGEHQEALERIARSARRAERDLDASALDATIALTLTQAKELGNIKNVTPPNLASLMFLVEEAGRTILLTGDGHARHILGGLRRQGRLDDDVGIHVNVLKVQHHGSENNIDRAFCRKVTADEYVFCGNGEHDNPDLDVIGAIADSRLGPASVRSPNPAAAGPFRFSFSSRSTVTEKAAAKVHMTKVETLVDQLVASSAARLSARFLEKSSFEFPV